MTLRPSSLTVASFHYRAAGLRPEPEVSAPKRQQRGPEGETPTLEGVPVHRLCSENNGCILVEEKMEACCGSDACLLLNEARDAARAAYERAAKEIICGCSNAQAVVIASGADRWRLCGDPSCGALAAASILALIDKEST